MLLLDVTISDVGAVWLWVGGIVAALLIILLINSRSNLYTKIFEFEKREKLTDRDVDNRAKLMLLQWKIEYEAAIREDAIKRSTAVHLGKITEHFIPFMSAFPYNTKDVRFVGSPIDLIIFDGHNEQRDKIEIIIVEVKTGKSKLSQPQQKIKDAVLNGRVRWLETGGDFGEKKDANLFN